jgi:hypothetical protein
MNERIRELSKQAGDYVNEVYTGPVRSKTPGKIWEDGHVGWHTQFNQKFAELIVKECQTVVEWAISVDSTIDRVPVLIREHFGVEP